MNAFELHATLRSDRGKGASRRLRHQGQVPGILYGAKQDPVAFCTPHNDLLLRLENETFSSHILTLNLDGKSESVVLKDLQRHPYKPLILHLDLLRVAESETLTMRVPLHFVNESTCVGVKQEGGLLVHLANELDIICLPKDLPEFIEIDVADLHLGQALHLGDIKVPEGVEIETLVQGGDPNQPVVSVQHPQAVVEEREVDEEEEAAVGELEAPAEEAPPED